MRDGAGGTGDALTIYVALVAECKAMLEQRRPELVDTCTRTDTGRLGPDVDGFDTLPAVESEQHAIGRSDARM